MVWSDNSLAFYYGPVMAPFTAKVFGNAGLAADMGKSIVMTAYQSAAGIVDLLTPTSGVAMTTII